MLWFQLLHTCCMEIIIATLTLVKFTLQYIFHNVFPIWKWPVVWHSSPLLFFFLFFSTIFFLDLVQTIYNIFSRLMQCGRRYPHRHQLENFKFMGRWIFQIDGVFTPTSVSSMFRLLQYMWTSFTHSIRAVLCLGNLHQKKPLATKHSYIDPGQI